jgi:hypothetical protein
MPTPTLSRRAALAGLAGTTAAVALTRPARAAPEADLWPRWEAHSPNATGEPDHGPWSTFLGRYLQTGGDGITRVAYADVTTPDRDALKRYLDAMADVVPADLNRDAQFAYWVNLYNALTVDVVLDHYPVDSIRDIDISPGWFADGPWGKKLITVDGSELSLDDIEHRILRPIWKDPRVHYAVNCAALGCPNLRPRPFSAARLDEMLTDGARAYVNHPRGARMTGDGLVVSSIYVWFQADFGGDDAGVIAHLKRYAKPGLAADLGAARGIDDHRYDWALNDANPGQAS